MSFLRSHLTSLLLAGFICVSGSVFAQNETLAQDDELSPPVEQTNAADESMPAPAQNSAPLSPSSTPGARGGVVSLQTTVTGNQEQPRVLYILPWQTPAASEVDFELLDSEESSVFGHVERNELRRELEATGEFD